jgi:hypothetical protein
MLSTNSTQLNCSDILSWFSFRLSHVRFGQFSSIFFNFKWNSCYSPEHDRFLIHLLDVMVYFCHNWKIMRETERFVLEKQIFSKTYHSGFELDGQTNWRWPQSQKCPTPESRSTASCGAKRAPLRRPWSNNEP